MLLSEVDLCCAVRTGFAFVPHVVKEMKGGPLWLLVVCKKVNNNFYLGSPSPKRKSHRGLF